jgi:ABC-type dipeptide/oligopeptide/nickel transport system permease component
VFIESIFNVPGLGGYFVSAILSRDYPLEMTLILFVTIFTVVTYLAADVLLVAFDPRVRLGAVTYD